MDEEYKNHDLKVGPYPDLNQTNISFHIENLSDQDPEYAPSGLASKSSSTPVSVFGTPRSSQQNIEPEISNEEKNKRKRALGLIFGKATINERAIQDEILTRCLATMKVQEEEVYVEEGIFIFRHKGSHCTFKYPVDEEYYLSHYVQDDEQFAKSISQQKEKDRMELIKKQTTLQLLNNEKEISKSSTIVSETTILRQATNSKQSWQGSCEGYEFASKVIVYEGNSLYVFHHKTRCRRVLVGVIEASAFNLFIVMLIGLNTMGLVLYDYRDRGNNGPWNQTLESIMQVTTYCFICEAVVKIVAQGLVNHRNAYLRDWWNCLDFFVVLTSIVELILENQQGSVNMRVLRTMRVFRPLRSINRFPSMKRLIRSLSHSIPSLTQAMSFFIVVFLLFAILGTQLFEGAFYQRCRTSTPDNFHWPYDNSTHHLCSMSANTGYQCRQGQVCGTPQHANLPIASDRPHTQPEINYGITTFDNLLFGFVAIFQMITLESWVFLMYNLEDAGHSTSGRIFSIVLVVVCSFFLLNVILAFLAESIEQTDQEFGSQEQEQVVNSLMRARKNRESKLSAADQLDKSQFRKVPTTKALESKLLKTNSDYCTSSVTESSVSSSFVDSQKLEPAKESQKKRERREGVVLTDRSFLSESHPIYAACEDPETSHLEVLARAKLRALERENILPSHARHNRTFHFFHRIVKHNFFNSTFIAITLLNTLTLSVYHKDMSSDLDQAIESAERVFRWCFLIEMVLKLLGLGFKDYLRDGFNIFDALLVILSLVEEGFVLAQIKMNGGAFSAFRGLRLLRVFRLARSWEKLQDLIAKMEGSVKDISTFSLLLLISMVIFMLLGRELYAYQIQFETVALERPGKGVSPRTNFDEPSSSFITIFIVIVGDDWNLIMYNFFRALYQSNKTSAYCSVCFFMVLYIMGNLVLLNLFLAILLANFDMKKTVSSDTLIDDLDDSVLEAQQNWKKKCRDWFKVQQAKMCKKKKPTGDETDQEVNQVMPGLPFEESRSDRSNSLSNTDHSQIQTLVQHEGKKQEKKPQTVKSIIDMHRRNSEKKKSQTKDTIQILKLSKKSSQAIIKIDDMNRGKKKKIKRQELVGHSLSILGPENRFRNYVADIVCHKYFDKIVLSVIIVSVLELTFDSPLLDKQSYKAKVMRGMDDVITFLFLLECFLKIVTFGFAFNGEESYLMSVWNVMDFFVVITSTLSVAQLVSKSQFKIFRLRRVLKPLSLIKENPGMKTVIQSLVNSKVQIFNLMLILVTMLLLFSILGTIFYSGLFYSCHSANIPHTHIETMWECVDYGGEWVNADANFDNIFYSMETMFEIITTEGWIDVMFMGVDAREQYLTPKANYSPMNHLFFISVMILGSIFLLNLFVGVVINNFNLEKEKLYRKDSLTPLQIEYCDIMSNCYQAVPRKARVSTGNTIVDFFQEVVGHTAFDKTVNFCIIGNTISMGVTWYNEPPALTTAMEWTNNFFTVVFTLEAFSKIIVHRKLYFCDSWNIFDFLIVVASWIDFTISCFSHGKGGGSVLSIFRACRVARLLRLIRRFKALWKIFSTLSKSLPQLANVAGLLMLLLLVYAVLGVDNFAKVQLQENLNEHANFRYFWDAMLTLFRCTTGESWNALMHDAGRQRSILFQCEPDACGSQMVAPTFFISFMLIVSIIFLNMFIAIILEGFDEWTINDQYRIKEETIEEFIRCWQAYDPLATGWINIDDLEKLIMDLLSSELKTRQETSNDTAWFNLTKDDKLLLYQQLEKDPDSMLIREIKEKSRIKIALDRYMDQFISNLAVPTYQKFSLYNFHDTLTSVVKHLFSTMQKQAYMDRKERIKRQQDMGMNNFLLSWDRMHEKSIAFYKLSTTDKEVFMEINSPNFQEVINRLEQKSNGKDDKIYKVEMMRELRQKSSSPFEQHLDVFRDSAFDSSMFIATKVIKKFLRGWRERRDKRNEEEKTGVKQEEEKEEDEEKTEVKQEEEEEEQNQEQEKIDFYQEKEVSSESKEPDISYEVPRSTTNSANMVRKVDNDQSKVLQLCWKPVDPPDMFAYGLRPFTQKRRTITWSATKAVDQSNLISDSALQSLLNQCGREDDGSGGVRRESFRGATRAKSIETTTNFHRRLAYDESYGATRKAPKRQMSANLCRLGGNRPRDVFSPYRVAMKLGPLRSVHSAKKTALVNGKLVQKKHKVERKQSATLPRSTSLVQQMVRPKQWLPKKLEKTATAQFWS